MELAGAGIGGEVHELSTSGAWPRAPQPRVTTPALLGGVHLGDPPFWLCRPVTCHVTLADQFLPGLSLSGEGGWADAH